MKKLKEALTVLFGDTNISEMLNQAPIYLFALLVGVSPLVPIITLPANSNVFAVGIVSLLALFIIGQQLITKRNNVHCVKGLFASMYLFLGALIAVLILNGLSLPSLAGFGFVSGTFVFYLAVVVSLLVGVLLSAKKKILEQLVFATAVSIGVFGILRMFLSVTELTAAVSESEMAFSSFLLFGIAFIAAVSMSVSVPIGGLKLGTLILVEVVSIIHILFSGSKELILTTALVALIIILIRLPWKGAHLLHRAHGLALLLIIVFSIGVGVTNTSLQGSFAQQLLQPLKQEVRPSLSSMGQVILAEWSTRPHSMLSGSGLSTFSEVWNRHMPETVSASEYWNDDFTVGSNLFLTSLIEVGLPLGLVFLIILLAAPIGILVYTKTLVTQKGYVLGVVGIVLFGVYWIFVYTPQTFLVVIFALFGGLLIGTIHKNVSGTEAPKIPRMQLVILAGISGTLLLFSVMHGLALYQYQKSLKFLEGDSLGHSKGLKLLGKSIVLVKFPESLRTLATFHLVRTQRNLTAAKSGEQVDGTLREIDKAIEYADQARARDGNNYRTHLIFGEVQLESGLARKDTVILQGSVESFNNAQSLAPNRISPLFALARAAVALNANDKAREYLEHILKMQPKYEPALTLLQLIQEE